MQNFYYLEGTQVIGPLSLHDLQHKNIAADTLVLYDGLTGWTKLKDIPKLYHALNDGPGTAHPDVFLRPAHDAKDTNHADSALPKFISRASVREKMVYKWMLVWVMLHCLAILLSLLHVKGFNNSGDPSVEKFWPFVKFTEKNFTMIQSQPLEIWKTTVTFNGIFTQYDWSEFSAYVGGILFLLLLYHVNKKSAS